MKKVQLFLLFLLINKVIYSQFYESSKAFMELRNDTMFVEVYKKLLKPALLDFTDTLYKTKSYYEGKYSIVIKKESGYYFLFDGKIKELRLPWDEYRSVYRNIGYHNRLRFDLETVCGECFRREAYDEIYYNNRLIIEKYPDIHNMNHSEYVSQLNSTKINIPDSLVLLLHKVRQMRFKDAKNYGKSLKFIFDSK